MIEQLKTLREFFKLPVPHSPQDLGEYLAEKSKAMHAAAQLEAMVGEQEPVAMLHDDGYWTPMKTEAGRALNDRLMRAGSVSVDVYAAPVAQQPQAEASWLTDSKQTKERQFAEFLNDRRSMNVSAVFHEVLHKFAELAAPQQAEAVPNTLQKAEAQLLNLIGEYWALAYAEGEEGRNHDTEDGAAQRTHAAIAKAVNDLIAAASSAPPQAEAVPPGWKHVCYLWVDPETKQYEVDHCEHPLSELVPAYIKVAAIAQQKGGV